MRFARSEQAREVYESRSVVQTYTDLHELQPAERAVLEALRHRLESMDMLDIGVGAGRTTVSFAPLVRRYVGVDYSRAMVEACRRRFAGSTPEPTFEFSRGTPAGYNDPELSRQLMNVIARVLGTENAIDYPPGMGGEDFGRFSSRVPGVQFRLGVGRPDRTMSLHSPTFDADEAGVVTGMRLVAEILIDQLGR